jgi:hypothetical protein
MRRFSEAKARERRLWTLYALCLEYPRNLPDAYPDEAITADLEFLASNRRVPWEIDEEFFEATWKGNERNNTWP